MHFYSITHDELLKLPIRVFWLMNFNIDRITAQNDGRSLNVAAVSQSSDGVRQYRERLEIETGTVVKFKFDPVATAVRDEVAIAELRNIG
jgi:hypothetical protein